jgi:hypothetical protein
MQMERKSVWRLMNGGVHSLALHLSYTMQFRYYQLTHSVVLRLGSNLLGERLHQFADESCACPLIDDASDSIIIDCVIFHFTHKYPHVVSACSRGEGVSNNVTNNLCDLARVNSARFAYDS